MTADLSDLEAENARLRAMLDGMMTQGRPPMVETLFRNVWRQKSTGLWLADTPLKQFASALRHCEGRAANESPGWVETAVLTWEKIEGTDRGLTEDGDK